MTYKHISYQDITRYGKKGSRRIFSDSFGLYQDDHYTKGFYRGKEENEYFEKMESDGYKIRFHSLLCDGSGDVRVQWIKYN